MGACIVRSHGGVWQVRRPLWESLVRLDSGVVVAEMPCGERPSGLALTPDGKTLLVSGTFAGDVRFYSLDGESLTEIGRVRPRFEPRGIAISPDGRPPPTNCPISPYCFSVP